MFNILDITGDFNAILFTAFLVTLFFFISLKKIFNKSEVNLAEVFDGCKNPECVRCHTYSETLQTANLKLKQFQKLYPDSDMTRIVNSLNVQEENRDEEKMNQTRISIQFTGQKSDQNPQVFRLTELNSDPWIMKGLFSEDTYILERNFDSILEEFKTLFYNYKEQAVWLRNDTPDGHWSVCHLINQGCVIENNVALCPKTFKIVSSLPSVMTKNVFGNVAFSVIEPQTVITEHYGPTNVRTRCHLGLLIPDNCQLTVNRESKEWLCGKCLIFDDSFLHSVQYTSSSCTDQYTVDIHNIRAVLMVDLWNPGVKPSEREIIDFIFPPKRH